MSGPLAQVLIVAAFAVPLLLAATLPFRGARPLGLALAPWAAAPSLAPVWMAQEGSTLEWDAALVGAGLGPHDPLSRGFLLLTSSVWLVAGLFARAHLGDTPRRPRFWMFFLITLSGNVGLYLARDVGTFYVFYAVMTYAAYGLVIHDDTREAHRAGRVYLVMSLLGEMLTLSALFLTLGGEINVPVERVPALIVSSGRAELVTALFLLGFGVKAGVLGLHLWLPLAHPAAPTPASAVLSGAMIKAGLFGCLTFSPLGVTAIPRVGGACVLVGFAGAFAGVILGVLQQKPKAVLAYSSVSQMGFMIVPLGVGLLSPDARPSVVAVTLFYAVHHAFSKGALFLGTGVAKEAGPGWPRTLVMLGLLWPALNIAGAPLSSGALAKTSLKHVIELAPWGTHVLSKLLSVGAVGSTLVVAHFLIRTLQTSPSERTAPSAGLVLPWVLLLLCDLALLVWAPIATDELSILVEPSKVWSAAWPVLVGGGLAAVAWLFRRRWTRAEARPPPGDLLIPIERLLGAVRAAWCSAETIAVQRWRDAGSARLRRALEAGRDAWRGPLDVVETWVADFRIIGLLYVVVTATLIAVSIASRGG